MIGGDGGRSGVPRHLVQLCRALADEAAMTVAHDRNRGGYDEIPATGADQIEMRGLRTSLHPLDLWRAWWGLLGVLRPGGWDIVWLHAPVPALMVRLALMARLIRPGAGTRIALTYHGLPFDRGHRRLVAILSLWIERGLLRHCPPLDLICLTGAMRDGLMRGVGARPLARHRLHVMGNCSDLGPVPPVACWSEARQLVITGRAGYQKNYSLAVKLMEYLPPNYVLTLCGAGTIEPRFQRRLLRAVRAETRNRIRFAGQVEDVRPLLARADCYLLTSRYEGLPIGAIEAFEAGLPLVLRPVGGARDLMAAHPLALCLPMTDLATDAARIADMVEVYRRDRPAWAATIRQAWGHAFGRDQWEMQVRALMREVLMRHRTPAPGCIRVVPAPLPDRHTH